LSSAFTVPVGKVADINPTFKSATISPDELVDFLPMAAVDEGNSVALATEYRPLSDVQKGYTNFNDGDVLLAKITPCFENGKIAQVRLKRRCGFGSTEFHVLRPHTDKLDGRYLVHFLRRDEIRIDGARKMTGSAGQRRVPKHYLESLPIYLPPLPEQRRIAAILDQADALRAKRREALAQLDSLSQSIFIEMFGEDHLSPITASDKFPVNPKGWKWELLTNYARLATGHTPDREKEEYWHGDIPWISLTDIRGLNGKWANQTGQNVTSAGIENSSAVVLPKGTVCFSRTASVGFVTIMGSDMATSQDFVNWVPGPKLDPVYLMHALMMSKPQLLALSTGSTHRTIYMRVVEHFRALMPPIDLQREFARIVDAIQSSKEVNQKSIAELDALFASLQHSAFRGEL
jgi:type I restriction enzyme S subunit